MHKHDRLTRKVRKAYRQNMLAQILTLPESKFGAAFAMETVHVNERGPENYYHYRDNGSRVLAVAHLDTVVMPNKRTPHFYSTDKGPVVRSGALDDRLGAYVILGLLPRLGITTDVLLTVGEEMGQSTAKHFTPSKDYDHVIEFDRAGTDVVMYQFEDEPSRRAVERAGASVGWGSFSDIAYLEHLGVKAFNWGVGYDGNYHSQNGYAYLNDTFAMVAKYLRFHKQNSGIVMAHDPALSFECTCCFALDSLTAAGYCQECGGCQECGDDEAHCDCYTPTSLRDWKADAEGESLDDTLAGARAAFDASPAGETLAALSWQAGTGGHLAGVTRDTDAGWAGAELALTGKAVTESTRRARNMRDAVAAFRTMPEVDADLDRLEDHGYTWARVGVEDGKVVIGRPPGHGTS